MGEHRKPPDRAGLERLSTDELKELIRADAESTSSGNEDYIFMVLEVIEERERGSAVVPSVDVEQAWDRFQRRWNTPDGADKAMFPVEEAEGGRPQAMKRERRMRRTVWKRLVVAAATIAALLVGMITAQAAGIDIRGMIARWTDDIFYFEGSATETTHQSEWAEDLIEHGLEASLIPTWIPEGFEAGELNVQDYLFWDEMHQPFNCSDGRQFQIVVQLYTSPEFLSTDGFEKDDKLVNTIEFDEIKVYFFANRDENIATFVKGVSEISVLGNISMENLEQIIYSIGGFGT